jgi:hypothetical protein
MYGRWPGSRHSAGCLGSWVRIGLGNVRQARTPAITCVPTPPAPTSSPIHRRQVAGRPGFAGTCQGPQPARRPRQNHRSQKARGRRHALGAVAAVLFGAGAVSGRSARQAGLSPVHAGTVPQRSRTGIGGHQRSPTVRRTAGHRPLQLRQLGVMHAGSSDCGPEGRSATSGSRWAATGVRNDRGARPRTVEDHDRRSCHRRPLTWHFYASFPVLNTA